MKRKTNNTVTKIALIVAIIALVFSIVTLIRAIIIKVGIPLAIIQVIGTAIIVAVCSIMLYVLSVNGVEDEDDDEDEDENTSEQSELPEPTPDTDYASYLPDSDPTEQPSEPVDSAPIKTSRYDLSNFQ